jgi:hypothetical protein
LLYLFSFFLHCFFSKSAITYNSKSKLDARLNKEKIFAEIQRKIFNITSWAGANITELINKWGNYTKKPKLQMVTPSILMKQDILKRRKI